MVDLADSAAEATFRKVVRDFIAEHGEKGRYMGAGEGTGDEPDWKERQRPWREALVSRGWIAPAWPKEWGGASLSYSEQFVLKQELAEAGLQNTGGLGVDHLGPTLMVHGTEEQKRAHLSGILSGDVFWCQGWSEPGAGSDLAALQTRAVRDGDDYVINGQKIWTSGAHRADWIFLLTRTDPDAPKHRGITLLMMNMKQPGVQVRPLINMGNTHGFNEVFFEDARTPVQNRIGEENRGWYVGLTLTDFERSSIGSNVTAQRRLRETRELAKRSPANQVQGRASATWRLAFADRWMEAEVSKLFAYRVVTMQNAGRVPNYEGSMAKVFLAEINQHVARTGLQLYGLYGTMWDHDREEADKGMAAERYLSAVSSTIAGGTSEIQRNIIATRGLGLPRG